MAARLTTPRTAALCQRLGKLETMITSRTGSKSLNPLIKLLNVLIAYHLGGAGPKDSLAEATARALGYDKPRSFKIALSAGAGSPATEDLNARWCAAILRLFELKDTTPDCNAPTFTATLEALFSELPEHLQQPPILMNCGAVSAEA